MVVFLLLLLLILVLMLLLDEPVFSAFVVVVVVLSMLPSCTGHSVSVSPDFSSADVAFGLRSPTSSLSLSCWESSWLRLSLLLLLLLSLPPKENFPGNTNKNFPFPLSKLTGAQADRAS